MLVLLGHVMALEKAVLAVLMDTVESSCSRYVDILTQISVIEVFLKWLIGLCQSVLVALVKSLSLLLVNLQKFGVNWVVLLLKLSFVEVSEDILAANLN